MKQPIRIIALLAAFAAMTGCFNEAGSVGIIGGADGPTAVYITEESSSTTAQSELPAAEDVSEGEGETSQSSGRLLPPRVSSEVSKPAAPSKPAASSKEERAEKMEVTFSQDSVPIGDLMMITVKGAPEKVTATTNLSFAPTFFMDDTGVQRAVMPVSYKTKPGDYKLTLKSGGQTKEFTITADSKEFVVQHLTVDQNTTNATIANDKANQEWNEKIEPLKYVSDPEQYWSGAFVQPVQGRITTEYASQRYTNGGATPSYHGGVDIAAPTGTPVKATGAGRVLFADFIALTGNTVIIEHGYGLKSFYYHMNGLNVKAGDIVEQGQQVGEVGSTGFSTGPHLHFAMAVNTVYTNPWPLIEKELK